MKKHEPVFRSLKGRIICSEGHWVFRTIQHSGECLQNCLERGSYTTIEEEYHCFSHINRNKREQYLLSCFKCCLLEWDYILWVFPMPWRTHITFLAKQCWGCKTGDPRRSLNSQTTNGSATPLSWKQVEVETREQGLWGSIAYACPQFGLSHLEPSLEEKYWKGRLPVWTSPTICIFSWRLCNDQTSRIKRNK